jgi:hypothetical protein
VLIKLRCSNYERQLDHRVDSEETLLFEVFSLGFHAGFAFLLFIHFFVCVDLLAFGSHLLYGKLQCKCNFLTLSIHIFEHSHYLSAVHLFLLFVHAINFCFLAGVVDVFDDLTNIEISGRLTFSRNLVWFNWLNAFIAFSKVVPAALMARLSSCMEFWMRCELARTFSCM